MLLAIRQQRPAGHIRLRDERETDGGNASPSVRCIECFSPLEKTLLFAYADTLAAHDRERDRQSAASEEVSKV